MSAIKAKVRRIRLEAKAFLAMTRAGVIRVESPRRLREMATAVRAYGQFGAAARMAALRYSDRTAIVDDRGEITYSQLDDRINRLANALRMRGFGPGLTIGILCYNHRQPLIASSAAARAGMTTVWLNTGFSGPQLSEVVIREKIDLLVYDAEFAAMVIDVDVPNGSVRVAIDDPDADELDALIAEGDAGPAPTPERLGRLVLLTSGTTGTPKGAQRPEPRSLIVVGALLERMPLRRRETTVVCPPLFHATGFGITILSLMLGSTVVLRRKFNPVQLLNDLETYGAVVTCVVPIMLQRVLALGDDELQRRDLSALRVVFCAGSNLPTEVATRFTSAFGDVIYNLYGSTEVAYATFATPVDVREAPTSVGKPMLGSTVKVLNDVGQELPVGDSGRIFVGTYYRFEGYTGGGGKEIVDGLLSTGDVGHFDENGRLHIDGRDDEMIVSGGENVFPREVEDVLVAHPAIVDAAAIGVSDDEFGRRLRAFVVVRDGHEISQQDVQTYVKDNLARYKVPREVVFVSDLPRNPTGKVLKAELAKLDCSQGSSMDRS